MSDQHMCQVAVCALNAANLRDWYEDVFGMAKSGKIFSAPPMSTDRIQGISPNPIETVSWLVEQQDYFQWEFFQFYRPQSVAKPDDWRPCDIGYNMVGVYVSDFDKTLARFVASSDQPPSAVVGHPGDRRACIQDPEGNWLEILERDPMSVIDGAEPGIVRPELSSTTRFMRVSVPDVERSRASFVDAMGLTEVEDFVLHTPEHEALWGLDGAQAKTVLLRSRNFLLELVEYESHNPRSRPSGYKICDQGFMNVALGYRETPGFDAAFEHAKSHGMRPNGDPVDAGIFRVMYVNDADDFSVEMLNARKALWSVSGFNARGPYIQNEILINTSPQVAWDVLIDHSRLGEWTIFKGAVLRPGRASENGPGCLRELTLLGARITEEIVSWEEGKHYTYKLRTGAPFKWHQGDIFVSEDNGLVKVRWAIRLQSRIPFTGTLIAWGMQFVFKRALEKLKRQLEAK